MKPAAAASRHMTADHQWPVSSPSSSTVTASAGVSTSVSVNPKSISHHVEEIYPFGIQNDLGQVCVPSSARISRENDGHSPHRFTWNHSPVCLCQSASNLAVPHSSTMLQSSSFQSLHSASIQYSRASSINDLSFEADQLERSIRQNDSAFVKRMLEIHHGKFNVNLHGSLLDKSSCDSHSQCISQEVEILLRKSQTLIDRLGRQESVSTDQEVPSVFTNALHLAIEHEAIDVIRMLLRYGVEPNEGGTGVIGPENLHVAGGRRGSFNSVISSSLASEDGVASHGAAMSEKTRKASVQLLTPRYAKLMANDSLESSGHSSSSPKPALLTCLHSDLPLEKRTVRYDAEGRAITYAEEYTRDYLYTLPALFLAVAMRNSEAVYLLTKYGANPSIQDVNGCTPLHLVVCQERISWPCVCTLLEAGSACSGKVTNNQGYSPNDLCGELRRLQESIVDDVFSDFLISGSTVQPPTLTNINNNNISLTEFPTECCQSLSNGVPGGGSSGGAGGFGQSGTVAGDVLSGGSSGVVGGMGNLHSYNVMKHTGVGLLRRLHSEVKSNLKATGKKLLQQKDVICPDEPSVTSNEFVCSLSHHGSIKSKRSIRSGYDDKVDANEKDKEGGGSNRQTILQRLGSRRSREKSRVKQMNSSNLQHSSAVGADQRPDLLECERKLLILNKMATNSECLEPIIRGLYQHTQEVIDFSDQATSAIHKAVARLLNQLLETAVCAYGTDDIGSSSNYERRCKLAACLSMLLQVVLGLMQGGQALQYTALTTLNKIIDVCIVYRLANHKISCESLSGFHRHNSSYCRSSANNGNLNLSGSANANQTNASSSLSSGGVTSGCTKANRIKGMNPSRKDSTNVNYLGRKWAGMWRQTSCEKSPEEVIPEPPPPTKNENILGIGILSKLNPGIIINILHNAITLHKRVVGTKQQCTPSDRWRHCSYHCLQILSARVLLYLSQSPEVQAELVNEAHLKVLMAALDSTHDPQLLCLVLQVVAMLALNPAYHSVLNDADIGDTITQLILPSDEWYYTNHSTKYARYVKHHSARILIYLGMHHRLANRVSIFDTVDETGARRPSGHDLHSNTIASPEDIYIMQTSLAPSVIFMDERANNELNGGFVTAASVEGSVLELLKFMEMRVANTCDNLSMNQAKHEEESSMSTSPAYDQNRVKSDADAENKKHELQSLFLMGLPLIIHPVILLRILMHRLTSTLAIMKRLRTTNLLALKNSLLMEQQSLRGSFEGCDNIEETLSKRRKVNLTVDCSSPPSTVESSPVPPSPPLAGAGHGSKVNSKPRRSSVKIVHPENHVVIRDHPALGYIGERHRSHSGSVEFAPSNFIRSSPSRQDMSDSGNSSKGDTPVTSPPSLSKRAFRFSSLVKKRSKSHANIAKDMSITSSDFSPPQSHSHIPACEADIMAFQRELQNLPQFDYVPLSSSCIDRSAIERTRFGRPRSRSVPKVILESSSLLAPPPSSFMRNRVGAGSICGLHRQLSEAGRTPPSQRSTPSVSPIPPSGTIMETTEVQSAVLKLVEEWSKALCDEGERAPLVRHELGDFVAKVSTMGESYKEWAQKFRASANIVDVDEDEEDDDNLVAIDEEYNKLQRLVVNDELPCSKDEAAALAGIQLRVEESWPASKRTSTPIQQHQLSKEEVCVAVGPVDAVAGNKLRTITEDAKESHSMLDSLGAGHSSSESAGTTADRLNNSSDTQEGESFSTPIYHTTVITKKTTIVKVQRKTGLLRQCMPLENNHHSTLTSPIQLEECIPSVYINAKNIAKQVKEHKRKLFHTSVYDSEVQLKKLYIQTCKRLPAYGCKIYQVKELLRGKTKKKATRLLGIGHERIILLDDKTRVLSKSQPTSSLRQWRIGGGRSHDRLILEFRGTKWLFVTMPPHMLKNISFVLWEIMQTMGGMFLEDHVISGGKTSVPSSAVEKGNDLAMRLALEEDSLYLEELESLQKLLHFPEEVALRLTATEYKLFCAVPPIAYIQQMTLDLTATPTTTRSPTITSLIKRFIEVSSWVTHIIISQPTHEDRKAVLSCILRVALSCWNIGNFNAATEILAGLKSEKLRPFWLSLSDKEPVPILDMLSDALLTPDPSAEYQEALNRAWDIPECKVVPFFGGFLRELKAVLSGTPSIVVLAKNENCKLEFISDYNGEDHYTTRIGVGGLINVDKLRNVQNVLDKVSHFHDHASRRTQLFAERSRMEPVSPCLEPLASSEDSEAEYEIDLEEYQPIQALENDHGVRFLPIPRCRNYTNGCRSTSPKNRSWTYKKMTTPLTVDVHVLQCLHHGSTVIRFDCDNYSRLAIVYLKLECNNATLTWCKPYWSALRGSGAPDYSLGANIEEHISAGLGLKYTASSGDGVAVVNNVDEGFLELSAVKEVTMGRQEIDLNNVCRRLGLEDLSPNQNYISLVYGTNLSDNRVIDFVAPSSTANLWYRGLQSVVLGLRRQRQLTDRRGHWLKEQYLQLYHEKGLCCGPTPAEAIKIFGGRKWTLESLGSMSSVADIPNSSFRRAASFGVSTGKFSKKKSQTALQVIKDVSPKMPAAHSLSDSTAERKATIANKTLKRSSPPRPQSEPNGLGSRSSPTHLHHEVAATVTEVTPPSPGLVKPGSIISRDRFLRKSSGSSIGGDTQASTSAHSITHSSQLDFLEFVELFHSFSIRSRKDLKDLFEQMASTKRSVSDTSLTDIGDKPKVASAVLEYKHLGLITRVSPTHSVYKHQRKKICDAIAAASIVTNGAGVETTKSLSMSLKDFRSFLTTHQREHKTEDEIIDLIKRHEPDQFMVEQNCLSFEGFSQYLMDKENYAFLSEKTIPRDDDMDHSLSHYYVATSHNTYLTGHQLKGESSVELYTQVLLAGCRCVELDCYDGDDGTPLIYHGHTLTTKIPFKNVVDAINKSAFVTSPYPVILSIENHCSLAQQSKMAHIFTSVFGDKLVSRFMFESDFSDDPQLPSPNQLRYKILIKNKKLHAEITPASLALNKKLKTSSTRTNSIVSNNSSLNENEDDDYDDDEDDEDDEKETNLTRQSLSDSPPMTINGQDLDDKMSTGNMSKSTSLGLRTESLSSQEGSLKDKLTSPRGTNRPIDNDWINEDDVPYSKQKQKQSSQISQDLSDLVIYCQAIKFRGLSGGSPTNSVKIKKNPVKRTILPSANIAAAPATPPLELRSESTSQYQSIRRQPSTASCYQISSLNENSAKKLSRKHPQNLIAHTENHIMRTYPAGMRIDSSNFNPVIFWSFGIQMVALNYQTEDAALHINTTLFEQNGRQGYVLKPRVMWDKSHLMYQRFNPWEKDFDGLPLVNLTLTIISGQHVCQNNFTVSTQVEVEIIGIQTDCAKQKSKIIQRNALNPIWNDTFHFRIAFQDLAFLRFTVVDIATSHITAQRVIPLKCLRPGYRHVRLRNLQNQPLSLSTLFIYSRSEEEVIEMAHQNGDAHDGPTLIRKIKPKTKDCNELVKLDINSMGAQNLRRRVFYLMVYGVTDEPYTILKITQDTTTQEVIQMALSRGNKVIDVPEDYVLMEEVNKGWEKKDLEKSTQRILAPDERPLEAQAQWKGEGRFTLKKTGDDPSSRAWISTILNSATKEKQKRQSSDVTGQDLNDWEEEETFLVCVHNVSPEIPYAILKAPISSTSINIITQALVKARRIEDPSKFVLVEMLEYGHLSDNPSGSIKRRIRTESRTLLDHENVYQAQSIWKTMGKFVLKEKDEPLVMEVEKKPAPKKQNSLSKLSKIKISSSHKLREKTGKESDNA